jgi:hypothetical protein
LRQVGAIDQFRAAARPRHDRRTAPRRGIRQPRRRTALTPTAAPVPSHVPAIFSFRHRRHGCQSLAHVQRNSGALSSTMQRRSASYDCSRQLASGESTLSAMITCYSLIGVMMLGLRPARARPTAVLRG